ncbi:Armadillo-type fold [Phytophthora cactorum]|nr:Armadillo-type fold [Phytophthora cactorum]
MPPRTPRSSLKKHDAAAESRALKARRQRTTAQVRKDKVEPRADEASASHVGGAAATDGPHRVLGDTSNASAAQSQARFETLKEIRVLLARHENDYEQVEQIIESGVRLCPTVSIYEDHVSSAALFGTEEGICGIFLNLWFLFMADCAVMVSLLNSASPLARPLVRVEKCTVRSCGASPTSPAASTSTRSWYAPVPAYSSSWRDPIIPWRNTRPGCWQHRSGCEEFRQQLIANGAVLPLCVALSNLARGFETPAKPFVDAGIIPVVVKGLSQPPSPATFSEAIVVEVAWLLSFLTAREEEYLKLMLEKGLVDLLLPYFSTNNELLLTPILRVFGNICCGSPDHHTDDHNSLPGTQQKSLAAEAAWVISNLAATEASLVEQLMQAQLLPLLGQQFKDGSYEVRREVAFALTNIALTSAAHMEKVLALDVLKGFLHLLTVADVAIVGNSLRFIENVLRAATRGVSLVEVNEGIDALETVQFECGEEHLSKWAAALVNEFYGENYGVNSPPSAAGVSGFNFPTGDPVQLQLGAPQQAAPGPGGRGRGAHMTTPAWKK